MATPDFVRNEVARFFTDKEFAFNEAYDLTTLDPEGRVVQVRDAKNRAPKEHAKRYAEQMAHAAFPAIILTKDGWIVDGNTRVKACQMRKQSVFPAYVIAIDYGKATDRERAKVDALAATMNAVNGNPLTPIETRRAIRAFLAYGFDTDKISKHVGASTTMISNVRRQIAGESKIEKVGLDPLAFGKDGQRQALGHTEVVGLNDVPFKRLAELTKAADLKPAEIVALGREAKSSGSDAAAIKILEQAFIDNAGRIRQIDLVGAGSPTPSANFRKTLGMVTKWASNPRDLVESDPAHIESYLDSLRAAHSTLTKLIALQEA